MKKENDRKKYELVPISEEKPTNNQIYYIQIVITETSKNGGKRIHECPEYAKWVVKGDKSAFVKNVGKDEYKPVMVNVVDNYISRNFRNIKGANMKVEVFWLKPLI